ncbi:Rpn family recombination-promoting nuclease/putative transposase [Siminovitchia sp. 179-K 8D1 HS]|uniref:Rpn family recombination-promoting nuclease/putative transposase n=1 Tax=Siminovitchia sp. 179-K 8D1 HS TaxID=3142385 RepID=UPI00399F6748
MDSKVLKRLPLERLMDLKVDYAFKQLFGSEKNKEITVVFLNAILQKTGREPIKDILFTNTEAGGEYDGDKQSRLDLLVVTNANEWINVEIQFTNPYEMINRSIYYWAGIYRSPMKPAMGYKELNPVIAINILNFGLFKKTDRFHTIFHLYEDEEKFKLTDIMEFHFIEMTKLISEWKKEKLNPWDDVLARWLLLLGIVDHRKGKIYDDIFKELEEIALKDETLRTAFQSWEELSGTQEEILAYQARLKKVLDEEAAIREAELREQEAQERGWKKGLEKGRKERSEEIARRLLANKTDVKTVAEITDLPKERVLEIQKEVRE